MTKDEMAVLNRIKFECAKMGIGITDEIGYNFKYKMKNGVGEMYTEHLIARYLILKTESQRDQLISCAINALLGNDGTGGAVAELA